ncbi:MAG: ParB N-terminal domain-containing protein [Proteobacteria bacterium]|nr:ParB N-terminal domain-containing protein [Pseudomonadota bacterium]
MSKKESLKIENVGVYDVKPWENNPRNNAKAITAVAESIESFGFNQPILIDQNNRIAAGHTRWEAAKLLNMMSIPCVRRTMTEAEFIAYNLADNKTGELASWDKKSLGECLNILDSLDSLEVPGFSDSELDKLFGNNNITESATAATGDFGEGQKVSEEKEADDESRVKNIKFTFSPKQYRSVQSKLKAIQKESNLDTMADALIKALEGFNEQQKVIKKAGPIKVTKAGE